VRTLVNAIILMLIGGITFASDHQSLDRAAAAASTDYLVYVSNERSGDVSVIDPGTNQVIANIPVGKRPRGAHCSQDGKKLYVAVSGSPRMAPGVDHERAAADKSADGIAVVDTTTRKVNVKLPAGSDPEQFAILQDDRRAVISNEDRGSASVIDLVSGEVLGEIKVSDEPEGLAVNPANGQVYVTCEEKGEVYVIDPDRRFSPGH